MIASADDPIDLFEGASVRIDGERFRVDRIVDHRMEVAVLVATRERASDPEWRDPIEIAGGARFEHVDDDVQPMLWGSAMERCEAFRDAWVRPPWIHRESQNRVIAALEAAMEGRPRDAGGHQRLVIAGPPGSGRKSTLDRFQRRYGVGKPIGSDVSSAPVAIVPPWISVVDFHRRCLAAVGVSEKDAGSRLKRAGRKSADSRPVAINAMREAGVRMLAVERIYDRSSLFVDASRIRSRLEMLDEFADDFGPTVVVVVHETSFRDDAKYPRGWREARHVFVGPCALDDDFRTAVRSFERRLPLREPSELDRADMIGRLFASTQGVLDRLWHYLVLYATMALELGGERIDHDLIDEIERRDREAGEFEYSDDLPYDR